MKKIFFVFVLSLLPMCLSETFAETLTAAGTMNTITESMNSLAGYGAFGTDVAKERIAYYNDQIYLYGVNLNAVMTGSETWARNTLWTVINVKLNALKEQGYLTKEKYESYVKSYSGVIMSESSVRLGGVYKDYKRFEQEVIDTAIPRMQDELYQKYKTQIDDLLKTNKITQEKHDTWIVKINMQVYQYKSDPDFMESSFKEEAARYPTPLASTGSQVSTPTSVVTTPATTPVDYSTLVKTQYGKQYEKMSLKNLQATLVRTRNLAKKYADGSKHKLKTQAMVELLSQEIIKRVNTPNKR